MSTTIKQFVNLWNRVQSRPSSDLVKIAMMDNCELAKQSSRKLSFGAGNLNSFVGQLCGIRYSLQYLIRVKIKLTLTIYLNMF